MTGFPEVDPGAAELHARWYAANAAAGTLTAQRCECRRWRHPARYRCPVCRSETWAFEPVTDVAVIHSWTVTRRALHAGFAEVVPYGILVAVTAEGPQYLVHLRPSVAEDEAITIGDPVRLSVDAFGVPFADREPM